VRNTWTFGDIQKLSDRHDEKMKAILVLLAVVVAQVLSNEDCRDLERSAWLDCVLVRLERSAHQKSS
jgi:hypothetical protein